MKARNTFRVFYCYKGVRCTGFYGRVNGKMT